jgi:hypothetical protein
MDLISYSAPQLAVGGIAGLMYPHQPAAVLSAQVTFVVLGLLGYAVEAMLRRQRNERGA